ncbi:Fe-Mn family superoxide dismutase [Halochromatium glycolicum]|uniref:Manganese/iron superoxide dismutase C-terminal domain-containing protein n=1 Tax=Halochromatium glycolicum TaxID=85075 RepID=A0AAJ0U0B9_9GAMM|nr:Fe-Mn family superoxide dismutase [Halochromatium glycolicum]MBK1703050.1 hypothetical protein [Halochromatium glycolicum]
MIQISYSQAEASIPLDTQRPKLKDPPARLMLIGFRPGDDRAILGHAMANSSIASAGIADHPPWNSKPPILTCDIWEHPCYVDYRNQ